MFIKVKENMQRQAFFCKNSLPEDMSVDSLDVPDGQPGSVHRKTDFHSRKGEPVDPLRVFLVMGAGVLRQHAPQRLPVRFRDPRQQLRRNDDLQRLPRRVPRRSASRR